MYTRIRNTQKMRKMFSNKNSNCSLIVIPVITICYIIANRIDRDFKPILEYIAPF